MIHQRKTQQTRLQWASWEPGSEPSDRRIASMTGILNTGNSNAVSKIWKFCSLRTGSNAFDDVCFLEDHTPNCLCKIILWMMLLHETPINLRTRLPLRKQLRVREFKVVYSIVPNYFVLSMNTHIPPWSLGLWISRQSLGSSQNYHLPLRYGVHQWHSLWIKIVPQNIWCSKIQWLLSSKTECSGLSSISRHSVFEKTAVHPPMTQRRDMDGFALFALAQGTEVAGNFGESATCQGKGVQVLWPMCHDG